MNPGVHFSILRKKALSEEVGSSGQLVWHLEMLLRFNYIKKIKVGHYTVFIPYEIDEDIGRILFILRDRINNKIIHLLIENETFIKSEIYKKIDEKREDVYYRINNLLNHGVITLNQDLDKKMCINNDLKEDIIKILDATKSSIKKT